MLALLASLAFADDCELIEEPEFRALVLDSQVAIDRGDVDQHNSAMKALLGRVPCMQFAPSPRLWADFLMSLAIYEFSSKGDWESPLAAALRLRPGIDRGVSSQHPLSQWEPKEAPAIGSALPDDVDSEEVLVDGLPARELPPASGMYLLQKREGPYYNTRLLNSEGAPVDWLTSPVDKPPHIAAWFDGGILLGGASTAQTRDQKGWKTSDYIGNHEFVDFASGLQARGVVTFYLPVGVMAQAAIPFSFIGPSAIGDGHLYAVWAPKRFLLGAGAVFVSVPVYEGGDPAVNLGNVDEDAIDDDDIPDPTWFLPRLPGAVAQARFGDEVGVDITLQGGARPFAARVGGQLGVAFGDGPWRLRTGVDAAWTSIEFEQAASGRFLDVEVLRVMGQVGFVWGEY